MHFTTQRIAAALRAADIEGLIESGAPADEYDSEAQILASALAQCKAAEINAGTIEALLLHIWGQSLNLSPAEIETRRPALRCIAEDLSDERMIG